MPLIKSISGIRGTIGNRKGEDLTKEDIVLYTRSFVLWLENEKLIINNKIVVGRDARISGKMVEDLVLDTLTKMGVNVVCLGLSTTPTIILCFGIVQLEKRLVSSIVEIYDSIIDDLNYASLHCWGRNESRGSYSNDLGRATNTAAHALLVKARKLR